MLSPLDSAICEEKERIVNRTKQLGRFDRKFIWMNLTSTRTIAMISFGIEVKMALGSGSLQARVNA